MTNLYSTTDCSKRLGVASWRITYAHDTGKVADAELRVAGKRVYTAKDLKRLAEYFGVKLNPGNKERRDDE